MWHALAVHGGTSLGGLRAFAIALKDNDQGVVELPEKSIEVAGTSRVLYGQFPVMGDGDDDMPALLGDSDDDMPALVGDSDDDMPALVGDSDEEDIHAPPGPAATAGGFANPGHQD